MPLALTTYCHKALLRRSTHRTVCLCLLFAACTASHCLQPRAVEACTVIAGASQVYERGLDLLQLHIPAGLDHGSRGGQGVASPHPSALAQPFLSHAPPADYQPQGVARPASAAHHETGQVPLHAQAPGSNTPQLQHGNNATGPSELPDHAADATAPATACPQVQFGVFTNLASGGVFMGPSKMSADARKAMITFASDDPAAPAVIQKAAGRPSGSWQQAACFARPGTRAVVATRGMQGAVHEEALKNPCHAHQQPLAGRQCQSAAQSASCMPAADPAEVLNPAAVLKAAAADPAGPTATNTAGPAVTEAAGPMVMSTTVPAAASAPAEVYGSSTAAGGCPPVQFGVFTNLRSGGMWAPLGKLSKKAEERANEVFPDGPLEAPSAAPAAAAPAFAGQAQAAQQQPAGSQPAEAAKDVPHTTGQLCSGMLCHSCHEKK